MAEELLGPAFEIHGGGLDLVFPHHENELAQSRALGHPFAQIWAHNGMLRFTGEKMSKSVGNIATIREALDEWGRETLLVFFLTGHWRKPIDFSDETMAQAARAGGDASATRSAGAGAAGDGDWERVRRGARRRLQHARGARGHARVGSARPRAAAARRSTSSASARSPSGEAAPPEVVALAERRVAARAAARLRRGRPAARRDRGGRLGDARRAGRLHARAEAVTGDLVYGRRAVREALRGRREVLELWATERAVGGRGLARRGAGPSSRPERELTERAGTRDHQGVVARVEPYRYADAYELAAAERPLLAVLDQVTDPRNLGAVCRSAEGAGATGVVVPGARLGGRHRRGRARVGRRGRAPADRGRHEPRPLPRGGEGPGPLGLRRRAATARRRCGRPTSPAASRSSSAPRARGCGRSSAGPATSLVSIPLAGAVESLNVSVAAALLLYEARRQRADG